jgi:NADPH:quinone reductase-like Zn-dependent oxidoreductase
MRRPVFMNVADTMRALRYDHYGSADVLRIYDVPEPSPAPGQAKIRVRAAGLNPLDWKLVAGHLRFAPMFRSPPRGVGCDFSGEVVAVGGGAAPLHVGDRVFGSLLAFGRDGACSEYLAIPYDRLVALPNEIDDVHAASLPIAGGTALQALTDDARVVSGDRVLITGAAGGVGHFAVQVAKHLGAYVVAVCSGRNVDFVRALGADQVVDYEKSDFTLGGDRFDIVFDAACASSFAASRRVLTPSGCYINTGGDAASVIGTVAGALIARFTSRQRAVPLMIKNHAPLWRRLLELVRGGTVRAHVERVIGCEDVADALRSLQSGHGRGKIVVRLT